MNAAELLARADAARAAGDVATMRSALVAAFEAARSAGDAHAMAAAALALPASQRFGAHPGQLPALLHEAYEAAAEPAARCRLAAALARSWAYGGDPVRAARFAAEARRLAEQAGTADAAADALDAALLAHWGPDDFSERISLAARLDEVAAHLTDHEARLSAHLWRLTTAWESLDIVAIQRQLRALEVVAEESGSARAAFFAVSRRAMHALATAAKDQGLAVADALIARTETIATELAEPDIEAVLHSLHAMRAMLAGDTTVLRVEAAAFEEYGSAEGIPSVRAEAAGLWPAAGRPDRAEQIAGQLLGGGVAAVARDVDFLLQVTSVAKVAAALGIREMCLECADALEPYPGRGVLNAGAVTFHGVVDDAIYLAKRALGDAAADRWHDSAQAAYRRIGAAWWERQLGPSARPAVRTPAARRVYFTQDDSGRWRVGDEAAPVSLPDRKGLHYLRYLLARPGEDIDALTLSSAVAGHAGVLDEADTGEILDATALAAYRRRLSEIDGQLDAADRRGDRSAAAGLTAERDALLEQLRSATGIGGRQRRAGGSAERARIAVRKAIAGALAQIESREPGIARLLRDCVRTGMTCRCDPDPDHPVTWMTG